MKILMRWIPANNHGFKIGNVLQGRTPVRSARKHVACVPGQFTHIRQLSLVNSTVASNWKYLSDLWHRLLYRI